MHASSVDECSPSDTDVCTSGANGSLTIICLCVALLCCFLYLPLMLISIIYFLCIFFFSLSLLFDPNEVHIKYSNENARCKREQIGNIFLRTKWKFDNCINYSECTATHNTKIILNCENSGKNIINGLFFHLVFCFFLILRKTFYYA